MAVQEVGHAKRAIQGRRHRYSLFLLGAPYVRDHLTDTNLLLPNHAFWLVAYLLLEAKRAPALRATVAEYLWEDASKGNTNLRTLLAKIRKIKELTGISLVSASRFHVWLDCDAAIDILPLAEHGTGTLTPASLCDLCRGELLDNPTQSVGDRGAEWLRVQRFHIRRELTIALTRFLEVAAPYADGPLIEIASARLLEIEPYQEPAYRALMRLYAFQGKTWKVREVYRSCRSILSQELGTNPSDVTIALHAELCGKRATPCITVARHSGRSEMEMLTGIPRVCVTPTLSETRQGPFQLAASLMDGISRRLCLLQSLSVIPTHTAWRLTGDRIRAARRASIDYVVDTRLLAARAGSTLAVNLVRTKNNESLWSVEYSLDTATATASHGDILARIASGIENAITSAQFGFSGPRHHLNAYRCWLNGQRLIRQLSLPNLRRARKAFRTALGIAPDFVPALSGVANTINKEWLLLGRSDKTMLVEAQAIAKRAIEQDHYSTAGHRALGFSSFFLGNFDHGLREMAEADVILPDHAETSAEYSELLMHDADWELAILKITRALEIDPVPPDYSLWTAGGGCFFLHRYEDAVSYLQKMTDTTSAHRLIAACAAMLGNTELANSSVSCHLRAYPDFRIDEWMATIPMRSAAGAEHYIHALRTAGFR